MCHLILDSNASLSQFCVSYAEIASRNRWIYLTFSATGNHSQSSTNQISVTYIAHMYTGCAYKHIQMYICCETPETNSNSHYTRWRATAFPHSKGSLLMWALGVSMKCTDQQCLPFLFFKISSTRTLKHETCSTFPRVTTSHFQRGKYHTHMYICTYVCSVRT